MLSVPSIVEILSCLRALWHVLCSIWNVSLPNHLTKILQIRPRKWQSLTHPPCNNPPVLLLCHVAMISWSYAYLLSSLSVPCAAALLFLGKWPCPIYLVMPRSKYRLKEIPFDKCMTPSHPTFRSLHSPGLTILSFLSFDSPVLLQLAFHTVTVGDRMMVGRRASININCMINANGGQGQCNKYILRTQEIWNNTTVLRADAGNSGGEGILKNIWSRDPWDQMILRCWCVLHSHSQGPRGVFQSSPKYDIMADRSQKQIWLLSQTY